MNINYVTLHNFGPHAHLETKLAHGLVGVFGGNGSGKTHLINGCYAALTNDFSRFDGVKTDRIFRGAGAKEESFVEIEATHNKMQFVLRRSLKPNKSSLKIVGEKEITKATEIEARLRNDLGVDMQLIDTYVFIDQWKISDFLSHTAAQRAEAFKYLCGTQKADIIAAACAEMLTDSELSADVVDNSDDLVAEIGRLEAAIAKYQKERRKHVRGQLNEKSLATAKQLIRKREKYDEVEADLEEERSKLELRQRKLATCQKRSVKKNASLLEHESTVAELKIAADSAEIALSSWESYDKRRKRKKLLVETKEALLQEKKKHAEPVKSADYDELEAKRLQLAGLRSQLEQAQETLRGLKSGKLDHKSSKSCQCPTCKQSVPLAFIKEQSALEQELPAKISSLVEEIHEIADYDRLLNNWNVWESGWKQRVAANKSELADFAELKEPDGDKVSLQKSVNLYEAGVEALETLQAEALTLTTRIAVLTAKVKDTQSRIVRYTERLTALMVEDEKLDRANRRLKEHQAAELAVAGVDGKLDEAESSLKATKTSLDQLRVVISRRGKLQQAMKILGRVREVYHWSNLPRMVAQGNLFNMEQDINDSLNLFGNPFWAEADENLGFMVHFPGNNTHRAEGLSGGQKGIFSIAFRFAVNSLFGADIGMMFLDEPTAGLDEKNIAYFEAALASLALRVRDKRQVVIVTHADALRPAFDQVIEV